MNNIKDPILSKDAGLVPVMHARGTSVMEHWCHGARREDRKIGRFHTM